MPHRTTATPTVESLLESYNALSPTKRRRKFKTVEEGLAAIAALAPAAPPALKREPSEVKARKASAVIRVMSDENPYRPNTEASRHFELMRGGVTILEYLAKFEEGDQRTARQWLWNASKKNYVKTIG